MQRSLYLAVLITLWFFTSYDTHAQNNAIALPKPNLIYETNYLSSTVEAFTLHGSDLGVYAMPNYPTGLAFDTAGNLYVSNDDPAGYSIEKIAPDGSVSIFATEGLREPHALAFEKAGNLYVANAGGNSIMKFAPDGSGTLFVDATDGLVHPIDLLFDTAGNLFVSNAFGGPTHKGSVLKFTRD